MRNKVFSQTFCAFIVDNQMVSGRFYKLALSDCEAVFEFNLFVSEGLWRAIRLNERAH